MFEVSSDHGENGGWDTQVRQHTHHNHNEQKGMSGGHDEEVKGFRGLNVELQYGRRNRMVGDLG